MNVEHVWLALIVERRVVSYAFSIDGRNYALSRPANQSSTWEGHVASKAVDGIAGSDVSFTCTRSADLHPWWKVDLAFPIWVIFVEITNRINSGKHEDQIRIRFRPIFFNFVAF